MVAACLIMLVTSLLFVSREIRAQQNAASVSAVVLPNEFNTRPPKQKNFIESMSTYQKITYGTGLALAVSVGIATYLLIGSRQGVRTQ